MDLADRLNKLNGLLFLRAKKLLFLRAMISLFPCLWYGMFSMPWSECTGPAELV